MRSEKRRLAVLISTVRPARSFAAKLATLAPEQLVDYRMWRDQQAEWHRRYLDKAYERTLEGDSGPQLHRATADRLFGPKPLITIAMTDAECAEAYRSLAFGD